MFNFTDALRLAAIFIAYGMAGHMDYEDAVLLDQAQQPRPSSASSDCRPTINSPPGLAGAGVGPLGAGRHPGRPPGPLAYRATEAARPCPASLD